MRAVDPFFRVSVRYAVTEGGGTLVFWEIDERFSDPLPHAFQLQGQDASVPTADFDDIGLSAENAYYLVDTGDDVRRNLGGQLDFHYRVKLTTSQGDYYSPVVGAPDVLDFRDWRIARDVARKERVRFRGYTALVGFLLKRRRRGPPCPVCAAPVTGQATDSRCPTCYGTSFLGGYYAPAPAYFELPASETREKTDERRVGDELKDFYKGCRMLGDPVPDTLDVFVDGRGDRRYVLQEITASAMSRGFPLVHTVGARFAPPTDIVYDFPVPSCKILRRPTG